MTMVAGGQNEANKTFAIENLPYSKTASVVVMKLTVFVNLRTGNILVRSDRG